MTLDFSILNQNQRQAVEWRDGPLLILAGPGAGKTQVLTYRIAYLLRRSPGKTFNILGLTFTNKAANDMQTRLQQLVPQVEERTSLTTFYSFCARILRQHGSHIGLRPNFVILSQPVDQEDFLAEVISQLERQHGKLKTPPETLLRYIIHLLNEYIPVDQTKRKLIEVRGIPEAKADEIAMVYQEYRHQMMAYNMLDLGGLITATLTLLQTNPFIRKLLHRTYPYVCLDEFENINCSQYVLLKQLVPDESPNLLVAADDDQIIYQWNGANPRWLESLRRDFKIAEIRLPENYRCPPEVVEVANRLISNQTARRIPSSDSGTVHCRDFDSVDKEITWVAQQIASRSKEERNQSVILAGHRGLLEEMLVELRRQGLSGVVPENEFSSAPLIWLHAILKLANTRQDKRQLSLACKAFSSLTGLTLEVQEIISHSVATAGDYLRSWREWVLRHHQLPKPLNGLIKKHLLELIDRLAFWKFIEVAFDWFDTIDGKNPDEVEFKQEKEVWDNLIPKKNGPDQPQLSLYRLLQKLELKLTSKTPLPPADAIRCYTLQVAKGLEFKHVYLIGLVEGSLPSWQAVKKGDNSHEMQEERRSCFVAMTHTKGSLTVTYASEYFGDTKQPSRFLEEMGVFQSKVVSSKNASTSNKPNLAWEQDCLINEETRELLNKYLAIDLTGNLENFTRFAMGD
jgi:DNA helicase II / ATP-dependent DNA helicase PcrA